MANEQTTKLAERLLRIASEYKPSPYPWLNRPPRLSDLWPDERNKYVRTAELILKDATP